MSTWDTGDIAAAVFALVVLILFVLLGWWMLRKPRRRSGTAPLAYGADFSWSRPSAEDLRSLGFSFVCRYLSWSTSGKNLTADEASYWKLNGFDIVSNWEYAADAAKGGYAQGVSDANEALRQHVVCGASELDPILFSIDYDVPITARRHGAPWLEVLIDWIVRLVRRLRRRAVDVLGGRSTEYLAVADYVRGIASVVGIERTGAYAEKDIITKLFNDGLITYGWQTYAWSGGRWEARAQLRQVQNGLSINGQSYDRNEAWAEDFGAWGQRQRKLMTGDGAVLLNCPFDPTRQDLFYVGPDNAVLHAWWLGGIQAMWNGVGSIENLGGAIEVGTLTALWLPDGETVYIAGVGKAASPTAKTSAYWAMSLNRYGQRSGWGTVERVVGLVP